MKEFVLSALPFILVGIVLAMLAVLCAAKKKRAACAVALILVVLAAGGALLKTGLLGGINRSVISVPAGEKKQICTNVDFDAQVVNYQQNEEYLKLDYIMPGLDTFRLSTVVYSLAEDKIVSEKEFGEGFFSTGVYNDGIFVIDMLAKEIRFFDFKCNLVKTADIPCDNSLAFAYLSRDGQYICFADAYSVEIYVCSAEGQNKKKICDFTSFIEMKEVSEHTFYLKGEYDDLLIIDAKNQTSFTQTIRNSADIYSSDYCVEKTDTDFSLVKSGEYDYTTIPISVIDELPLDVSENRLITVSGQVNKDVLRIYNFKNKTVFSMDFSERIMGAKDLDNGLVLVSATEEFGEKPKLYLISSENKKASENYSSEITVPEISTENTVSTEDMQKPKTKIIEGVPVIAQYPEYPTGCESVSAVMAMQYLGDEITVGEFVDNYLDKNGEFYFEGGKKYGPDPYRYFIGSPRSNSAFGCMAPVIEKALNKYYGNSFVYNTTGTALQSLCSEYIDNDIPVLVWVSIEMLEPDYVSSWYLEDGSEYQWPDNEHCMVLVGYDDEYYYLNDPYRGALVKHSKELCEERYAQYDSQSLVINR
ncbi:MAG: C39 family peptidase [Ruminococcus sp.]